MRKLETICSVRGRTVLTGVLLAATLSGGLAARANDARACECCARSTEWSRTTRAPSKEESRQLERLITLTGLIEETGGDGPLLLDTADPVRIVGRRDDRGGWGFRLQGTAAAATNVTFLFIPEAEWEFFRTHADRWTGKIDPDVELYKEVVLPGTILFEGQSAARHAISRRRATLVFKGRGNNCLSHDDLDQWVLQIEMKEGNKSTTLAAAGLVSETSFVDGPEEEAGGTRSYANRELGMSFDYPADWGGVVFNDYRSDSDKEYALGPAGADFTLSFDRVIQDVSIVLYYTEFNPLHPYKVSNYEGSTDTTFLAAVRQEVAASPSMTIDSRDAKIDEWYFGPGETMNRKYTVFAGPNLVEIRLSIVVVSFNTEPGFSSKGFENFLALNEANTELTDFMTGFENFLASIEFR